MRAKQPIELTEGTYFLISAEISSSFSVFKMNGFAPVKKYVGLAQGRPSLEGVLPSLNRDLFAGFVLPVNHSRCLSWESS